MRPVSLRREVVGLVLAVVALDAVFVAIYFLAGLHHASSQIKVAFTTLWTLATLGVVIRGLSRVRRARVHRPSA
ncbi:MAG TPA: hypothetical protein VF252_10855 [Gemmatimonadales bacterium]